MPRTPPQVLQPWVPWAPDQAAAFAAAIALHFQQAEATTNAYLQKYLQQGMSFNDAMNASVEEFNSNPAANYWSFPSSGAATGVPSLLALYGIRPTGELILPIHSTGAAVREPLEIGVNRVAVANTGSGLSEVRFRLPGANGEVTGTRLIAPGRVWARLVTTAAGAARATVTPDKPTYLDLLQGRGSGITADPSFDVVVAPNG